MSCLQRCVRSASVLFEEICKECFSVNFLQMCEEFFNVAFAEMCEECTRAPATCRCTRCQGNMCGACFSRVITTLLLLYLLT